MYSAKLIKRQSHDLPVCEDSVGIQKKELEIKNGEKRFRDRPTEGAAASGKQLLFLRGTTRPSCCGLLG